MRMGCDKHHNVKTDGEFCPICLFDERDSFRAQLAALESSLRESEAREAVLVDVNYLETQIAWLLELSLVEGTLAAEQFVTANRKQLRLLIEKAVSSLPARSAKVQSVLDAAREWANGKDNPVAKFDNLKKAVRELDTP